MSAPLFRPFRALGYITEPVPFAVQRRGKETFVTVSVGKAWQVYDCANLRLKLVGPQLPGTIRALECAGDLTFSAVGPSLVVARRVKVVAASSAHTAPILRLLCLGGQALLSLGTDRKICVWSVPALTEQLRKAEQSRREGGDADSEALEWAPEREIQLAEDFQPTCFVHPDTYLNKVLVGSEDGRLQLWNFATSKLIYEFKGLRPSDGPAPAVRSLAASPALDVVGVGLSDGRAVLLNLKFDEKIAEFHNAAGLGAEAGARMTGLQGVGVDGFGVGTAGVGAAVTALSFRTGPGTPLLACGGGSGAITLWNLEERRLHTVIREAHDAPLFSLHFFPGEPLLMSGGADNALRQFVLDNSDGTARMLRFRSGHAAPPTCVRYYGLEGLRLLSGGFDRAFRVFSTIQDQQSREISQKNTQRRAKRLKVKEEELKLPPLVAMAASELRERDWANAVTAHEGDPCAYTWKLKDFSIGEHVLRPPRLKSDPTPDAPVTAVAVTACGNYALVGSASGRVDRYNLQSGLHRGSYASTSGRRKDKQSRDLAEGMFSKIAREDPAANAHRGLVTGIATDAFNRFLVTSGSDGFLRVWDFRGRSLQREIPLGGGSVTRLSLHRGGSLVAAALEDLSIKVVDILAGRVVRRFPGHSDRVTDLQVSGDGQWVLSSSMDGTLATWDIPSGTCLQVARLGSSAPITAFSLAPNDQMLATCHVGRRGIYLWANQKIFGNPAAILPSSEPVDCRLPDAGVGLLGRHLKGGGVVDDSDSEGEDEEGAADEVDADEGEMDPLKELPNIDPDPTRTPTPLTPELITFSLVPRNNWHSLAHLSLIKQRNMPVQGPTKDAAQAPFFLTTIPSLARQPVFDVDGFVQAEEERRLAEEEEERRRKKRVAESIPLPGWGVEEGEEAEEDGEETDSDEDGTVEEDSEGEGRGDGAGPSRIRRLGADQASSGRGLTANLDTDASMFLRLLTKGGEARDYSSFVSLLRKMSPSQLDAEIRALEVFAETATEDDLAPLEALMDFFEHELSAQRNFEFVHALLRVFLEVHSEVIAAQPSLSLAADRLHALVRKAWLRLDNKINSVRALVMHLGNLQA